MRRRPCGGGRALPVLLLLLAAPLSVAQRAMDWREDGNLRLGPILRDSAVLQWSSPCLHGWLLGLSAADAAGASVTVSCTREGCQATGRLAPARSDGEWRLCLPPQPPGGPTRVAVEARSSDGRSLGRVELEDILFGDVWVASGQSNMHFTVRQGFNATAECAAGDDARWAPLVRVLTVEQRFHIGAARRDFNESSDLRTRWLPVSRSALCVDGGGFSAVGWFFARALLAAPARRSTPLGIIQAAAGGTRIQLWAPPEALAACPGCDGAMASAVVEHGRKRACAPAEELSSLFNQMIAPLTRLAVRGVLWWQGEAEVLLGVGGYDCLFRELIRAWRARWAAEGAADAKAPAAGVGAGAGGEMPFLFVQLEPYHGGYQTVGPPDKRAHTRHIAGVCLLTRADVPGLDSAAHLPNPWRRTDWLPAVRLMQAAALDLPATAMVSALDCGDPASPMRYGPIHTRAKQPVGARLAAAALRVAYGDADADAHGPRLVSVEQIPDADAGLDDHSEHTAVLRLRFSGAGAGGLRVTSASTTPFALRLSAGGGGGGGGGGARSAGDFGRLREGQSRVPAAVLPGSADGDSLTVFATRNFAQVLVGFQHKEPPGEPIGAAGGTHATSGAASAEAQRGGAGLDALWEDWPSVTVYGSNGLPMEPFAVPLTRDPASGLLQWRAGGERGQG